MMRKILTAIMVIVTLLTLSCKTTAPSADSVERYFYIVARNNPGAVDRIVNACGQLQIVDLEILNQLTDENNGIVKLKMDSATIMMIKLTVTTNKEDDIAEVKKALSCIKEVFSVSVQ